MFNFLICTHVHVLMTTLVLLGVTFDLIWTIQQYSPVSEWMMCELGVFPIFLESVFLRVDKILGLTFFKARKD